MRRIAVGAAMVAALAVAAQLERTRGAGGSTPGGGPAAGWPAPARPARAQGGERLSGEASVTRADLSAALPVDVGLRPVEAGGRSARAAGRRRPGPSAPGSPPARAPSPSPPDGLLGGLASLTVFDDARVVVDGVGARPRPDGFTLTAAGRLR